MHRSLRTPQRSRPLSSPFESLEPRLAMSAAPMALDSSAWVPSSFELGYAQVAEGITYNTLTGAVNVYGTPGDDKVEISQQSSSVDINTPPIVMTTVSFGQYEMVDGEPTFVVSDSETFFGAATQVKFWGYGGDDEFFNHTSIPSIVYGGGGNDELHAGMGNDQLFGGAGNDRLYAAAGSDLLDGGAGDDVLVSIGGGQATLFGGFGDDSFWLDTSESVADASMLEQESGFIHEVDQFMAYSFDGGDTSMPVGKELTGGNLPDPLAIYAEENPVPLQLIDFGDQPLFASSGPSKDDIFQGSVGDCYFMAPLSAIADANPEYIEQMVVDLGDGTYAVRFYDDGQEVYVRVDADLYVTNSGDLRYADLGQEGSLWVAIVEKAYAYFRSQQGSYESIAYGNGTLQDHLNLEKLSWKVNDGVTAEQVIQWFDSGSPAGAVADAVQTGATQLLEWMDAQLAAGQAVYTGARSGVSNTTPLQVDDPDKDGNQSTFRRGQHIYMVDTVLKDGEGNPTGVLLRDPYGFDRLLTDFTRIYFCLSAGASYQVTPPPEMPDFGDFRWQEATPLPFDPVMLQRFNEPFVLDTTPTTRTITPTTTHTRQLASTTRELGTLDRAFESETLWR